MSKTYFQSSKAFPCQCGGYFERVYESRGTPRGEIWRRRKCTSCNARITTYEQVREADAIALADLAPRTSRE